jgi:hypothetical protein
MGELDRPEPRSHVAHGLGPPRVIGRAGEADTR